MMLTSTEYFKIASHIQMMKYIHGADFVNATLLRHSVLRNALLDYEKRFIIDTESDLSSKG